MGYVRPLFPDDIPQVVRLYARVFGPLVADSLDRLQSTFHEVFLRHPWPDQDLPSLVYQEKNQRIVGCLGVMPRPMSMNGRPICAAISHTFMVDPASRSTLAAVELVRAFLSGPQDGVDGLRLPASSWYGGQAPAKRQERERIIMPADRGGLDPSTIRAEAASVYVCPDCKTALAHLYCEGCHAQFSWKDDIPILLSNHPRFKGAVGIAAAYDSIYRKQRNVWENQGRTPEFLDYLASVLAGFPCARYLEIGCGEGALLARLTKGQKWAIDLSTEALKRARTRTQAHLSIALAERLPFPSDYFDLVAGIGVMEHFLDMDEAIREIRRVLKPGGHYVVVTHVTLSLWERSRRKIAEYVFPRPKPIQLMRWAKARLKPGTRPDLVKQPIQNVYTIRGGRARLEDSSLKVVDVIHTARGADLPLDPWVVLYIAAK